ncbi:MAG: hypothetical protein ABIY52_18995 [Gemmatimonadaceae bacterium]
MRRPFALFAFGLLTMVVAACASSGTAASTSDGGCALQPKDSVYLGSGAVYRDCAVATKVKLVTNDVHPDFTPSARGNGCYSAEFEFVVNTNGVIDLATARLLRTNNQQLADATLSMLPRLRYEPATIDGKPVAQITTMKQELITKTVVAAPGQRPNPGRAGPGC